MKYRVTTPIPDLPIGTTLGRRLLRAGIKSFAEISGKSESEILSLPGIAESTLREIRQVCRDFGWPEPLRERPLTKHERAIQILRDRVRQIDARLLDGRTAEGKALRREKLQLLDAIRQLRDRQDRGA